jgi:hypothetical protein
LIASSAKNGELTQQIANVKANAEQLLKQSAQNGRNIPGQDTLSQLKNNKRKSYSAGNVSSRTSTR